MTASAYGVAELAAALANFPSDGKPPADDLHFELILLGFIQEHEVKKPCRNCGASLTDYRFLKLTAGGRMFLAAALGTADAPTSPAASVEVPSTLAALATDGAERGEGE